ncbi:MAG: hypothetical protein K9N10_10930, partial [Deltaproteobacteria bacterium]|nr:hypothetical protein [Deltaproteobacteria bacterium]
MVSHCLLHGDELKGLIGKIMKSRAVMGPKERPDQPGFHYFDWLGSPEELVWNYSTTTLPPKKAFFPP